MICYNPMCRDHVPMPARHDAQYVRVVDKVNLPRKFPDGAEIAVDVAYREIKRYIYRTRNYQEIYLCGPCHAAVQMSRSYE